MNSLVVHVASGMAFFTGGALIVLGLVLTQAENQTGWRRFTVLLPVLGGLFVIASATPLPNAVWPVCAAATVPAIVRRPRWRSRLVIGIAGLDEGEAVTWPELLRRSSQREVIDLSHVGETVSSSHRRLSARSLPETCIVIMELGGNDLLGSTSVDQFRRNLEDLLKFVVSPDRAVFLMELPLPPFCNEWGRVQRELAIRHGVKMIPRRCFMSVLGGSSSTFDSIHLSQVGHDRMLRLMEFVLRIHR